jgi:chaperonin GroES
MSTKPKPLGDRILVKALSREETTKSGIVLPDTAKERPQEGIVEAVGTGRRLDSGELRPLDVHEGQRVLFTKREVHPAFLVPSQPEDDPSLARFLHASMPILPPDIERGWTRGRGWSSERACMGTGPAGGMEGTSSWAW